MSRRQTAGARSRPGDRKREERAARRAQAKERRNQEPAEDRGLSGQLRGWGLRIREVPGDGNCLFRALGDQLEGHSRNHLKHRQETVDYMIKQRQDFEPFVEDDVPFDKHVSNLAKPGTFAGNDAIVAFARNHQVQVVIHQMSNPLWQIRGTGKADAREMHIVYRHGEHYDSLRRINDNSETPANLQTQMLCKDGSNLSDGNQQLIPEDAPDNFGDDDFQQDLDEAVQKVRNATACSDVKLILESLEAENYDVESAIAAVLQMEELSRRDAENLSPLIQTETPLQPCPALLENTRRPRSAASSGTESKTDNRIKKQKSQNCMNVSTSPADPLTSPADAHAVDHNRPKQPTNKQRKEQARLEKKRRQEERHRQKVLESCSNNMDNNKSPADDGAVTLVKPFTALTI